MKKILLIGLCLLSSLAQSQDDFSTEFFVSDFNENPVTASQIEIYASNGNLLMTKTTDETGIFDTRLVAGKYHIKLKQQNQIKKEADVNIPELEGNKMYNQVRVHVLYEAEDNFTIENLNFEQGSAKIKPESYEILDKLAVYISNRPDERYQIAGHTDADGSETYNLDLSTERAKNVRQYLVAIGVSADQLSFKGYGESSPIEANNTEEGKAKNRRTELVKLEL